MALSAGSILAKLGLDSTAFTAGMAKATAVTDAFGKSATKSATATAGMSKKMKTAMLGVGAAIAASLGAAMKFNSEMANIATLMPKSASKVVDLKKRIQELSVATGKGTSDIAGGAYQVVSAFGEAAAEGQKLDITVRAAAAGMATTTDALNLLSATTKGYGDTSDTAYQHAADLAFTTVRLGQTTFPELAASIGKTIPLANKMNVSAEELYASFATLTGVTGSAAEVSTQLSGILGALIKPTPALVKVMEDLGFANGEAMIAALGLNGALKKIIGTTDGTSISLGKLVRRKEALTAITALTGASAKAFTEKYKEMGNVVGATGTAWKAISEGINKTGFEFDKFKQEIIVTVQQLGDFLLPVLNNLLGILQPLIKSVAAIFTVLRGVPDILTNIAVGAAAVALAFAKWGTWGAVVVAVSAALSLLPKKIESFAASTTIANEKSAALFQEFIKSRDALGKYGASLDEINEAMRDYKRDADGNLRSQKEQLDMVIANIDGTKTSYAATGKLREAIISLTKAREAAAAATRKHTGRTAEETTKVSEILNAAHEKYMQLTLTENEFRRWQIDETFKKERETLVQNNASRQELFEYSKLREAELTEFEKLQSEERLNDKRETAEGQKLLIQEYWDSVSAMRLEREESFRIMDEQVALEAMMGRERELEEIRLHYEAQKEIIREKWLNQAITAQEAMAIMLQNKKDFDAAVAESDKNSFNTWLEIQLEKANKFKSSLDSALKIYGSYLNARQKKLDSWYENEKKRIETSTMSEEDKEKAMERLDENYAAKKNDIMRKQFKNEKALNIATAIMNVASAVIKALSATIPPFNYILAAAVGVFGAALIGKIAGTPMPLKEGGVTQADGLAYLHKNEVVTPIEKINEVFNVPGSGGGNTYYITLSALDTEGLTDFAHDKLIPILQDASAGGQFNIDQRAVVANV